MPATSALRPITQKLNSTPVEELPNIAGFLATSLANCSHTLSAPQSHATTGGNEDAILIHKLKTRLSSLLQDRKPQGRWTAVVLIKSVIEAGGWEVLKASEPWARGLLSILGKPDPVSTKRLAVIALTRIFLLTQPYPTLLREITTPLLPSFLNACLNLLNQKSSQSARHVGKSNPLLATVLEALSLLLPQHPATFRPFASRIHELVLTVINDDLPSNESRIVAERLFASLHYCAAKNAAASEWEAAFRTLISSIHVTTDQVFRAVIEDWESSDEERRQSSVKHNYDEDVGSVADDPLGLPTWEGIPEGASRIVQLLDMLSSFQQGGSAASVALPVGMLLDLTARMSSVLIPKPGKESSTGSRSNPEVGREERDELFLYLPAMHLATINLLISFLDTVQGAALAALLTILEQASWIFNAESDRRDLRLAIFILIEKMLPLIGPSATKTDIRTLNPILRACADDCLLLKQHKPEQEVNKQGKQSPHNMSTNADNFLTTAKSSNSKQVSEPVAPLAAWKLLLAAFQNLPSQMLPHSLRTELDRTAILAGHKEALLASILNPSPAVKGKPPPPSLLPWLAQYNDNDLILEGLLRPRMPLVSTNTNKSTNGAMDEEADDDTFAFRTSGQPAPWDATEQPNLNGGTSLLDKLEEQLPLGSPSTHGEIDNSSRNNNTALNSAAEPHSARPSPQKRTFTHLDPPPLQNQDDHSGTLAGPPSPKRIKPDSPLIRSLGTANASSHSSEPTTTTVQPPNIITENVAPISSITLPADAGEPPALPASAGSDGGQYDVDNDNEDGGDDDNDDDGSSDFEMPVIDPEPDTEDELEEEEDEDEKMDG